MSFHSCLQNLRSAFATGRGRRRQTRPGALRAARYRPNIEVLEDRSLLSFSPVASLSVGSSPQAVVVGDFNNDSRVDLVAPNQGSNSVSVLLGTGDGTFPLPLNSAAGNVPQRLVAADFNNDGKLDLVVSTTQYLAVARLLLGHGDGTFQAPIFTELGFERDSIGAGDFNSDGNMDLVQVLTEPGVADYVRVYLGDGTGHFAPWGDPIYFSDYDYTPMAVADVNGDNRPDVVLAHDSSYVSVLLSNADGTLRYHSSFDNRALYRDVRVGDFTGDGIPDLAAAGNTRVGIMPGDGAGNFGAPILQLTQNANQTAVATADFNGDGRLDVVTPDESEGTLTALLGQGNGSLSLYGDHAIGLSPRAVAVGDFNGDGRSDAVTANAGSNTVSVLLNDGNWPPATPALRIGDGSVTEGNVGAVPATFTVTLSAPSTRTVIVAYTTADGSATAGNDYAAASGTLTFAPGETRKTATVTVYGDRLPEPNETFFVNLSSPTNATIDDGQGVGTVADDEPRISINDVSRAEGKKGQTMLFTFTVTLSNAYDQAVTLSFRTVNGTAQSSDNDYVGKSGTLTFAPGETTKTITIEVKGDGRKEANETFYLDLFGLSSNSLFTKNRGVGTILNDD